MIIKNYMRHPIRSTIVGLSNHGYLKMLPDKAYVKLVYFGLFGKRLNLKNPRTYNEKLQWLKLYDRRPEQTTMVDKYAVKEYVAKKIGSEYLIPTIGVWDRAEDIDFDALPDQFVLKCTHDSGSAVICRDKASFDRNAAVEKLKKFMKRNFYLVHREWPYKNVPRKILAEKYMSDIDDQVGAAPNDYKIQTFNGKAKLCHIIKGRGIKTTSDYFDRDFVWCDMRDNYENAEIRPKKPENYEKMFELAEILAKGTKEVRVDFYEVNGKIYFGELTFFQNGGFDIHIPKEWDEKLGSWIDLNA